MFGLLRKAFGAGKMGGLSAPQIRVETPPLDIPDTSFHYYEEPQVQELESKAEFMEKTKELADRASKAIRSIGLNEAQAKALFTERLGGLPLIMEAIMGASQVKAQREVNKYSKRLREARKQLKGM
ncbi:hypothetical protein IQ235_03950 [Oscillatoriales cyanobacterium LEGE 11467]|uniref:Uncharacterized protein n=1 Tax=Zarconia navalis LEGE 11467 TaxID=1828826 RepID=A0A928VYD4_9CYAN|nr:hypothetical protein [Zarconia navalis]MBE9039945.1 hypothetical protein [Zarconia navalis LEGE 11467]